MSDYGRASKGRWGKVIKDAIELASNKGLMVRCNMMSDGWSILLPNGTHHHAKSDGEMVKFVRGY